MIHLIVTHNLILSAIFPMLDEKIIREIVIYYIGSSLALDYACIDLLFH